MRPSAHFTPRLGVVALGGIDRDQAGRTAADRVCSDWLEALRFRRVGLATGRDGGTAKDETTENSWEMETPPSLVDGRWGDGLVGDSHRR